MGREIPDGEAFLLVRSMLTFSVTEEEQYPSCCPAVNSGHGIYGFDIKKRKTLPSSLGLRIMQAGQVLAFRQVTATRLATELRQLGHGRLGKSGVWEQ